MSKLKQFLFGEHSLRQTLAKNSFWSSVSNIGSNLIKLIIVVYAARLLGAEQYGLFAYALSVAATFTILSDLGLNYVFFINIARRDENPSAYFPTLILLRLSLVVLIIILTILIGPFITKFPEARILLPLVAFLVAFDDFRAFLNGFARAENRVDKEAFGNIATSLLVAVLAVISLNLSPDPSSLVLAYLVGSILGASVVFFLVWRDVKKIFFPFSFSLSLAKKIFALAIPFSLASSMWMIMTNTDALVIGWFRSAGELGFYAAAQRPVLALSLVPTIIAASSLALIARAAKEGAKENLKKIVEKLVALSIAIVLPLAVGGIILAPSLVNFLYGADYLPAVLTFRLLLLTLVISYPASIITNLILAFKQQKTFTVAMIAGAVGNLILDLLLIPPFGIAGSVIATLGALTIINGYIWYSARKLQAFKVISFLPRILIATALMGVTTSTLYILSANFFANIAISVIAYLAVLFLTHEPLLKEFKDIFR